MLDLRVIRMVKAKIKISSNEELVGSKRNKSIELAKKERERHRLT